jgi:hypothetical protein
MNMRNINRHCDIFIYVSCCFEVQMGYVVNVKNSFPILWWFFFFIGLFVCFSLFFKMNMFLFPLIQLGFHFVKFLILVVGIHIMLCETYSFWNSFSREIQVVCLVKILSWSFDYKQWSNKLSYVMVRRTIQKCKLLFLCFILFCCCFASGYYECVVI